LIFTIDQFLGFVIDGFFLLTSFLFQSIIVWHNIELCGGKVESITG